MCPSCPWIRDFSHRLDVPQLSWIRDFSHRLDVPQLSLDQGLLSSSGCAPVVPGSGTSLIVWMCPSCPWIRDFSHRLDVPSCPWIRDFSHRLDVPQLSLDQGLLSSSGCAPVVPGSGTSLIIDCRPGLLPQHILMYASKRFSFSPTGYAARTLLAGLDYNHHRPAKREEDGSIHYVVIIVLLCI
ncbi:CinA-like protein [Dissostichus eleginoides]|uniref:CinA-like protein n=1 Tax=Dissostichus eleginoides TaxID=100907 RepID=A0AAD9BI81_DISEL|nr:CinA-like protein [Dissostichus eleginoides]